MGYALILINKNIVQEKMYYHSLLKNLYFLNLEKDI